MTLYDTQYWLKHGATYPEEFRDGPHRRTQEAAILNALAPLRFDSVLEIGCGFGRITRVVRDAFRLRSYLATDVSADALDRARQYVDGVAFKVLNLDQPQPRRPRHLVLAAEVLMHRTPEQVIVDAEQLAGLATKYILNVDWYEPTSTKSYEGCYQHDYASLFAPFGTVTRTDIPEARQALWLTEMFATGGIVPRDALGRVGDR